MSTDQHSHEDAKAARREQALLFFFLAGGVGLVAILLSPFLMELMDKPAAPPQFHEDTAALQEEQYTPEKPLGRDRLYKLSKPKTSLVVFDNYGGIKLGSTREEVEKIYPLHLKSKPDAVPTIYEATNQTSLVYLQAHFYRNRLREFSMVVGPFAETAKRQEDKLYQTYGEGPRYLIGHIKSKARVGTEVPELAKFFRQFDRADEYMWGGAGNVTRVTLYSVLDENNQAISALGVWVGAVDWLKDYWLKEQAGMVVDLSEPATGSDEDGAAPPAVEQPGD